MNEELFVSIIIPVIKLNDFIEESLTNIQKLSYSQFEVLIVTDKKEKFSFKKKISFKVRLIESGQVGPSQKRDLASQHAKGEILAFLDDDAYPQSDWLNQALRHFNDPKVAAVGGPAITPNHNSIIQKLSGAVFESYIGGAGARKRYLSLGKYHQVDDWPTVNLLVRKSVFDLVGGFDSHYYPGEDTKLCLEIINRDFQIIYEPKAIVYHHRRKSLLKHFKQIGNYGLHRGYFAKKFPQTSFRLWYFIPSFFSIYLFVLLLALFYSRSLLLLSLPFCFYLFALLIDALLIAKRWHNLLIGIFSIPMILLTHLFYGLRFIQGYILSRHLKQ